ncbi:hypothetical protein K502DRAFT_364120 [Neoconidiobolus thromboides FSU 785]|nr:hypothetical protein K502DRAFT_364120 [Neoconidiobolus thromboides FSU 785]
MNKSDISSFIINPLSSFHTLLFLSVISYFIRLMLTPELTVVSHTLALFSLTSFWLGSIISITLLQNFIKTLAPTLTTIISLDISRHVLSTFNKFEILISITLLHLLEMQWTTPTLQLPYKFNELESLNLSILSPIVLVGFLQTCWLLPALLHRSQFLIASNVIPDNTTTSTPTSTSTNGSDSPSQSTVTYSRINNNHITANENQSRSFSYLLYIATEVVKVSCLIYSLKLLSKVLIHYVQTVARH